MASKGPKTGAKAATSGKATKAAAEAVIEPVAAVPAVEAAAAPAAIADEAAALAETAPVVEPAKPVETLVEAVEAAVTAVSDKLIKPAARAVTKAVPSATKTVTNQAPAMKELDFMTNTFETVTEKSQAVFAEMNERAKAAMEKNTKLVEEMNDLAKGHVEALVESGKIAAKGMEALSQDAVELSRKQFEQATAMLKSLSAAKSPTEFVKIQSDYFRSLFDTYVAETSKSTESFIKLAGDAAQPISNRVAVAADKMKIAA